MTAGGPRKGSGRKPVEDKKKAVTIYTRESRIERLGVAKIKEIAEEAIEKHYKKKTPTP